MGLSNEGEPALDHQCAGRATESYQGRLDSPPGFLDAQENIFHQQKVQGPCPSPMVVLILVEPCPFSDPMEQHRASIYTVYTLGVIDRGKS